MKNVSISLSNDLVQVLDSICEDCDLSRYAFAKEALLEKIEKHTKKELENKPDEEKEAGLDKATNKIAEDEGSIPPFIKVVY